MFFNFTAAVTICSDFGAQKNEICLPGLIGKNNSGAQNVAHCVIKLCAINTHTQRNHYKGTCQMLTVIFSAWSGHEFILGVSFSKITFIWKTKQ